MMNFEQLFGALPQQYCTYFSFLSVFFFVMAAVVALSYVMGLFGKKKQNFAFFLLPFLSYFVMYFQNRLLYTMCAAALH